jgi:hypothetical protein
MPADDTDYRALYEKLIAEIREGAAKWRASGRICTPLPRHCYGPYDCAPWDPPFKPGGIRQRAMAKVKTKRPTRQLEDA